jgi:hypothetical protein
VSGQCVRPTLSRNSGRKFLPAESEGEWFVGPFDPRRTALSRRKLGPFRGQKTCAFCTSFLWPRSISPLQVIWIKCWVAWPAKGHTGPTYRYRFPRAGKSKLCSCAELKGHCDGRNEWLRLVFKVQSFPWNRGHEIGVV